MVGPGYEAKYGDTIEIDRKKISYMNSWTLQMNKLVSMAVRRVESMAIP